MYGLPQTTEVKKQIPKKALFAKFDLKASQRDAFDADVARMDIVAVVSTNFACIGRGSGCKRVLCAKRTIKTQRLQP